jgi:hypothetical protein
MDLWSLKLETKVGAPAPRSSGTREREALAGTRVDLEPLIVMSWNVTSLLGQVPWKPKLVERLSATLLQENYLAQLLICTDTRVSRGPDAPHPGGTATARRPLAPLPGPPPAAQPPLTLRPSSSP